MFYIYLCVLIALRDAKAIIINKSETNLVEKQYSIIRFLGDTCYVTSFYCVSIKNKAFHRLLTNNLLLNID